MGLANAVIRGLRGLVWCLAVTAAGPVLAQSAQELPAFEDPVDALRKRIEAQAAGAQPPAPAPVPAPATLPAPRFVDILDEADAPEQPATAASNPRDPLAQDVETLARSFRQQADSAATASETGILKGVRIVEAEAGRAAGALSIPVWAVLLGIILALGVLAALIVWALLRPRAPGPERARAAAAAAERHARTDPDDMLPETSDTDTGHEDTPRIAAAARDRTDPSEWRKPNLDRLRQSIKDDWKASRDEPAAPRAEPESGSLSGRLAGLRNKPAMAAAAVATTAGAASTAGASVVPFPAREDTVNLDDPEFWDDEPAAPRAQEPEADDDTFDVIAFLDDFDEEDEEPKGEDKAIMASEPPFEQTAPTRSPEEILARIRAMSEAH